MTSWRAPVLLFLLALLVYSSAAVWIDRPGYMDADYYLATAVQLAEGRGFSEPFAWNYLAGWGRLPQPSHLYWMPLASILAALPMALFGASFRAAQIGFVLVAALIPPLTHACGRELGLGPRGSSFAGALALFPGFFLPFWLTTDAFAVFAAIGGAALVLASRLPHSDRRAGWLAMGVLIGLAHLSRADGLLLALPAAWAWLVSRRRQAVSGLLLVAGYGLIMGPWMLRTYRISGAWFAPGAWRSLFLTDYDQLFAYPASRLSLGSWLAQSPAELAGQRLRSLAINLQSLALVNGLVFLAPLMAWGAWLRHHTWLVRFTLAYLAALLVAMSLIFPFPGARGGYFHSSSAVMPVLWPLAVLGLDRAVKWAAKRRRWRSPAAVTVFRSGALAIAAAATAFLFYARLLKPASEGAGWGSQAKTYELVASTLAHENATGGPVAVNNPPAFWWVSRRAAVVIPNGDERALLRLVGDYGVDWVVLEADHPHGLNDLYERPGSVDWLAPAVSLEAVDGKSVHLLRVLTSEAR